MQTRSDKAVAVKGELLEDYEFEVQVTNHSDEGKAGIFPLYIDSQNYLKVGLDAEKRQLEVTMMKDGKIIRQWNSPLAHLQTLYADVKYTDFIEKGYRMRFPTWLDAVYLNRQEVDRQAEEAERANRFALARNGLLGGSVNIDANEELNRRTNEGLMQAQGLADDAAASLRSKDENTKQSLLSMANNGINAAQASQLATEGLKANLQNAAANEAVSQVGNLFGDMQNAYLYNQAVKQNANLYNPYYAQQQKDPTAPQNSYGGTVS